jgi:hypothetical protein
VAPPEGRDPGGPILHGIRFIHSTWSTAVALGLLLTERGAGDHIAPACREGMRTRLDLN